MNWSVSGDPKRSPSGETCKFPTITDFPRAGNVLIVWFLAIIEEQPCTSEVLSVPRIETAKAVHTGGSWDRNSFASAHAERAAVPSTLCLHPQPRYAMPLQTLAEVRPDSVILLILQRNGLWKGQLTKPRSRTALWKKNNKKPSGIYCSIHLCETVRIGRAKKNKAESTNRMVLLNKEKIKKLLKKSHGNQIKAHWYCSHYSYPL